MVDAGILTKKDQVELIKGKIVAMMPIGPWHSAVAGALIESLVLAYHGKAIVNANSAIGLDEQSEPQPDVVVLRWRADRYAAAHPEAKDVLLCIEVADSSRVYDLGTKHDLYAEQGIQEFWVVDRQMQCVHVFRDAQGGLFRESRVYRAGEEIALPECDGKVLPVTETGL